MLAFLSSFPFPVALLSRTEGTNSLILVWHPVLEMKAEWHQRGGHLQSALFVQDSPLTEERETEGNGVRFLLEHQFLVSLRYLSTLPPTLKIRIMNLMVVTLQITY